MVRDQEAGGSNPLAPTNCFLQLPAFLRDRFYPVDNQFDNQFDNHGIQNLVHPLRCFDP